MTGNDIITKSTYINDISLIKKCITNAYSKTLNLKTKQILYNDKELLGIFCNHLKNEICNIFQDSWFRKYLIDVLISNRNKVWISFLKLNPMLSNNNYSYIFKNKHIMTKFEGNQYIILNYDILSDIIDSCELEKINEEFNDKFSYNDFDLLKLNNSINDMTLSFEMIKKSNDDFNRLIENCNLIKN